VLKAGQAIPLDQIVATLEAELFLLPGVSESLAGKVSNRRGVMA
jgi:hypothetical protein